MIVALLLPAVLSLFFPAVGLPDPGDNVPIAGGTSGARAPSLAVNASGSFHVAWEEDRTGEEGIYYARSDDGLAWSPPVRIDPPGGISHSPSLAVEREVVSTRDRVYVAYERFGDVMLVTSDDGTAWSVPQRIDKAYWGVSSSAPSVAASGGHVYVAWQDYRFSTEPHIFLRASEDGGGAWGPEVQVSARPSQNILPDVGAKGATVAVVWKRVTPGTAVASARSEDAGMTWSRSLVDANPPPGGNVYDADVFVDELGTAHAVWIEADAAFNDVVRYASSGDGAAWSLRVRVDDAQVSKSASYPSVSELAGTLWVAWSDDRNGDSDVFASWSTDGASWGDGLPNGNDLRVDDTDRNADPADDATPQLAPYVDTGGLGVFVAWQDFRSGDADPYFSALKVSPLVVTEIQDEPASEARVEIHNFDRVPFDLAGVELVAGSTRVDLSPLGSAPARGHLVIGAAPSDLVATLVLAAEGDRVQVVRGAEVLADTGYGTRGVAPDPLTGESTARYAGTLDYVREWTRSPVASFGSRNAVTPPDTAPVLVLNEVRYNAAAPADKFAELYFRGSGIFDLTGVRLVGDAVYTFPSGTVGPAARHPLVLYPRAPALFDGLAAAGDNLYLYDATGRLLDMVGWSRPHTPGWSLARATEGVGGHSAFDDPSATANGWWYDVASTPCLLELGPETTALANIGTTERVDLLATNRQFAGDTVNVVPLSAPPGWGVSFEWPGGAPLTDSPGDPDLTPDLGLVGSDANASFVAAISIPIEGPLGAGGDVTVLASFGSLPSVQASVTIHVQLHPYLDVTRTVSPSTVYVQGTGAPYNEVAQVTVTARGEGLPVVRTRSQDVVFQIDVSGSMNDRDQDNIRALGVKGYIDLMQDADRASVIGFNDTAWVVADRPLTSTTWAGKATLKDDVDTLACSPAWCYGWTNIETALDLGRTWLETYGDPFHALTEILLTDGVCEPSPCVNTTRIVSEAVADGIVIYTIGLGYDVDEGYLRNISEPTGGQYFFAETAYELLQIYQDIGTLVNVTAATDPNPRDNVPMVEDVVPSYITVLPGTFWDPLMGRPRPPAFMTRLPTRTVMQWNVSHIDLSQAWAVRYDVTSSRVGIVDVAIHPDARLRYQRWDGASVVQPIPQATLEVLARPPDPPFIVSTQPADGATAVPLNSPLGVQFNESMDGPTVTWTITPFLLLTPSWPTPDVLSWSHPDFIPCTTYTVEITAGRDLENESLVPGPVPNPWSFTTICPVQYTITRSPVYGVVYVDGAPFGAPATFSWIPGDVHTISAPALDPFGASRLAFLSWDNGGPRDQSITVGNQDLTITAAYALQHPASLTLVGLEGAHPAAVTFTLFAVASQVSSYNTWSSWVDNGSVVTIEPLLSVGSRERYRTLDVTQWTVVAPLDATVRYLHQFRPHVRLEGTDANHTVGVAWTLDGTPQQAPSVYAEWYEWADASTGLRFANVTTGVPARRTQNQTSFTVDSAFDATIWYVEPPPTTNWKPLFAFVYAVALLVAGFEIGGRRALDRYPPRGWVRGKAPRPPSEKPVRLTAEGLREKVRKDRRLTRFLLILPAMGLEAAIGILSLFTGLFSIPEAGSWFPVGFWVNTLVLVVGLAIDAAMWRTGYAATEEAVIALIERIEPPQEAALPEDVPAEEVDPGEPPRGEA